MDFIRGVYTAFKEQLSPIQFLSLYRRFAERMPGAGSSRLTLSRHRTPAIVVEPPSPCPEPVPAEGAEGAAAAAGGQDRGNPKDPSDLTKQSQTGNAKEDANATNRKRDARSPVSDDHQPPNPKRRNRKIGNIRHEVDLRNCTLINGFGPSHPKNLRSLPSRNSTPCWYDDNYDDGDGGNMDVSQPQNGKDKVNNCTTTPQGKKSKRNRRRNKPRAASVPVESPGTGQNVEVQVPKPNGGLPLNEASGEITEEEFPIPVKETAKQNQDDLVAELIGTSPNPEVAERSPHQDPMKGAACFGSVLEVADQDHDLKPTVTPTISHNQTNESDTSTMSTETVIIPRPGRNEDFTIEGLFNYLLPRAAGTRSSSQHLLADILRRDNIFLVVRQRHREILENSYLMETFSTEDLFRQLLSTLKGMVQGELVEITRNYYEVLNILN